MTEELEAIQLVSQGSIMAGRGMIGCGLVFALFMIPVLIEDGRERIMNAKNKMKYIVGAWFFNLFVFTATLWAGSYAVHNGQEWMQVPCQVTLTSTGVVKIVLSVIILICLFTKTEEPTNEIN